MKLLMSPSAIRSLDCPSHPSSCQDYYVGRLVEKKPDAEASTSQAAAPAAALVPLAGPLVALNPREKVPFRLSERIEISHNTRILRFALPSPEHRLGLPCGKHVFVYAKVDEETVMRAYTPISSDDDLGRLDLLVKVGFNGVDICHFSNNGLHA